MQYFRQTVTPEEVQQALPIFVFGTLRPGYGNDRLWHGRASDVCDGTAILRDHRLVSNGSFPYCLPAEGQYTIGTLIVPDVGKYQAVLSRMDDLEGVPHHYTRQTCMVETPGEIIQAHYYIPDHTGRYEDLQPVPSNDWAARGNSDSWWKSY